MVRSWRTPVLALLVWAVGGACATETKNPAANEPAEAAEPPPLDPRAMKALKAMGELLGRTRAFTFRAEANYDAMLPDMKIERGITVDYRVRKPAGMRIEIDGDFDKRLIVYDGTTVVVYDRIRKQYGMVPAPYDELGVALDAVANKYGIVVPFSDFVYQAPYVVMSEKVQAASYVGLVKVDGKACHHLVFSQPGLDWQIWIEDGAQPLPRKMVMIYTDAEGAPQFRAKLTGWALEPEIADSEFTFAPPAGAEEIEVRAATAE